MLHKHESEMCNLCGDTGCSHLLLNVYYASVLENLLPCRVQKTYSADTLIQITDEMCKDGPGMGIEKGQSLYGLHASDDSV